MKCYWILSRDQFSINNMYAPVSPLNAHVMMDIRSFIGPYMLIKGFAVQNQLKVLREGVPSMKNRQT